MEWNVYLQQQIIVIVQGTMENHATKRNVQILIQTDWAFCGRIHSPVSVLPSLASVYCDRVYSIDDQTYSSTGKRLEHTKHNRRLKLSTN